MKPNKRPFMEGLKEIPRHLTIKTVSAGTLAAVFGCTGPALIIIGGAQNGSLTNVQTASWLFSVYFFGAVLGIFLSVKYRQPIAGAWSIPGAVLVAAALKNYPFSEAVGAFFVAGIIVFILGISGLIGKVMEWIPVPIVMGMIAGAMIKFGVGIVTSLESAPIIAGSALAAYLLSSRMTAKIPPILSALLASSLIAALVGQFQTKELSIGGVVPQLAGPSFSLDAIISISIPLALLVIGAENAQATGVLMAQGYRPPVNEMTVISGVGGMVASLFGGHNANIAGPMTAICASDEAGDKKESRYAAVFVNGILFGLFGLSAGIAVSFVAAMPEALIGTVAGLAMIGVLVNTFQAAFQDRRFQVGTFFALVIAMSGVNFLKISSPFWALVGGVIVSYILEKNDFNASKSGRGEESGDALEAVG
ncbi:benzoate/H(+) symporter BenE family transporter [Melghirimyces profundicolus]|uniref:benzoate/H(+) symporter BenE family transporter n=1 Tax=Melghirimyces profundicolus TaxID=1242148 RepID=UPI001FE870C8|nr:benzoate/H(+) symporter BenE family transporter [Melghirimyces profundicolus]